jgi:hypothetical protein
MATLYVEHVERAPRRKPARETCALVSLHLPRDLVRYLDACGREWGASRAAFMRGVLMAWYDRVRETAPDALDDVQPLVLHVQRCVEPTPEERERKEQVQRARFFEELEADGPVGEPPVSEVDPQGEERRATLRRLWREAGLSEEDVAKITSNSDEGLV